MAFAQGSRSGLSVVVESTFGVTPSSPAMVNLPFNTHSLGLTKDTLESAEIRSDRQISVFRHGNKQVGGTVEVDFRADDFDELLESAFFNTFDSSGILETGLTQQSLTIEDRAEDISEFRVFTGCVVSSMTMSIQPNAIVTASFDIVGKNASQNSSALDASITDSSTNDPYDSFSGTLLEGGSSIAIATGLEFTVDNSNQPTFVIGSDVTPQLEFGRSNVTGTLTVYYEDETLINKFINETESSLQIALADGVTGNTYTFLFPRIKYAGGDLGVQSEQSRILTLPFQALLDSVTGTNLRLTVS